MVFFLSAAHRRQSIVKRFDVGAIRLSTGWVTVFIITAAGVIAYYPVLFTGFVADDYMILYNIKHYTISDIGSHGMYFRPLVYISFAIDSLLSNDNPTWFHWTNLMLHILASLGVAACSALLIRKQYAGLIAGLIFVLHPIHPEAVTWIAGRYDVMCGMLLAWSFYFYLCSNRLEAGKHRFMRGISIVLFGLACTSKEMAFPFPIVLVVYELIFPSYEHVPSLTLAEKLKRISPFFILALLLFFLRLMTLGGLGGYVPLKATGFLGIIYQAFLQPLFILFYPVNRLIFDRIGTTSLLTISLILLAPLLLLIYTRIPRIILFSIAAVIISILPTAHLGINETRLESSRFLYLPSIFFAIMIAGIFLQNRFRGTCKRIISPFLIIYISTLFFTLYQNNYPWIISGQITRAAISSTEKLVERHAGQWGKGKTKIIAFNVPMTYLGAATLVNTLPYMLHLKHDPVIKDVEIEVNYTGFEGWEDIAPFDELAREGAVIWVYDDTTSAFLEYESATTSATAKDD